MGKQKRGNGFEKQNGRTEEQKEGYEKMYDQELKVYFEAHREEYLEDLASLVAINSERMEAKEGMPFGEGAAAALKKGEEILKKWGMTTRNYENYCITGDLNDKERAVDILAHLDVVPAGEGWSVTEPFVMKEQDGRVYGRGTADDKGPALCALYAMRAIKELNIPLKKGVRLILGSDEECGSGDIEYYFSKEPHAPMSFSPDADFPLINIEKGGLHSGFTTEPQIEEMLPRILEIKGGVKINVVPDRAEALVEGISMETLIAYCSKAKNTMGLQYSMKRENIDGRSCVRIFVQGQTAHASTPEDGKNAVTGLLQLLSRMPFAESVDFLKLKGISKAFPYQDYDGTAMGVNITDPVSGHTSLALTMFTYSEKEFTGMFDCRASIAANDENLTKVIYERFKGLGLLPMEDRTMYPPHQVDADSFLVKSLMKAYMDVTGDTQAKPLAIGGGTYVHDIDNGVAYGCGLPGVDNRMHGADEFFELRQIEIGCQVLAQAIINLCNV